MRIVIIYFLCCISFSLLGQQTPAAPQSKAVAVRGATIHVGNGTTIENGLMLFDKGKLQEVTTVDRSSTTDLSKYKIIEAEGMDIYPGFISPNTSLGLSEIGAVRATNDARELGYINPSIRSIIAYSTDSRVTPTIRSNGVLLAQIAPSGGRISGQSTIVELDAWNWEDAAYKMDEGMWLNWPRLFSWTGWRTGNPERKKDEKYPDRVQEIEDYLKLAKAYAQTNTPKTKNLKYEAMRGIYDGTKQVYIRVNKAKSIMEAVLLCKKFDIKPIIVGAEEAWRVLDFLATNEIAVILGQTQSLPGREDDDIDQPFKNAQLLSEKGILFAFSIDGSWQQRNLPFQAGQAVAFGLDYEKAIAGLTLNAAKIMGIDATVGSLEKGKDATFIMCKGDVLDMRTNKITNAFIQGKAIDLDNKQKALYRKFTEKYEGEEK